MEKSKLRLLVVEDEKKLCDMIAKSLHQAGYEVDTCNDGEEALDMIYAEMYDLIVLDTYSGMGIIPMDLITKEYFTRVKNNLKKGGIVVMNILTSPNFSNAFAVNLDNTIRSVFTHSLSRQVIGNFNAWGRQRANVVYVYYDVADEGGIYTADKNAVFYDM